MTFGCALSQTIFGPTASPEALRTLTQQAEALGFDAVWFADHIVIPRQVQSAYPYAADSASPFDPDHPFSEPLSVLNFLAGCTQRIRLGTHVLIIPYRHPVFTAKILATLDVLSGGRLMLGAGASVGAPSQDARQGKAKARHPLSPSAWHGTDSFWIAWYWLILDIACSTGQENAHFQ